jgi:hypothetical protein
MHPEIAKTLVTHHRDELAQDAAACRRVGRRRFPRWHVSWTRAVLAPAPAPVAPGAGGATRAGQAGRHGSSLVIIISAHRSA